MHKQGVTVTRNVTDAVDVALHVGRIRFHANAKKNVLRVGPACIDSSKDYKKINGEKWKSVKRADAIIYQSEFSKKVYRKFVGKPDCLETIVFNGADPAFYNKLKPAVSPLKYNFLAAQRKWIPQARLKDIVKSYLQANIRNSALWIAGKVEKKYEGEGVYYIGLVDDVALGRMYKLCDALIHMVYLDACSNSVVESMVAQCPVISGMEGGTIELIGAGVLVNNLKKRAVIEKGYHFQPINLNKPPKLDTKKVAELLHIAIRGNYKYSCIELLYISNIAKEYSQFFRKVLG